MRPKPLLLRVLSVGLITAAVMAQTVNVNRGGSAVIATLSALLAATGLGLLWILSVQSGLARS